MNSRSKAHKGLGQCICEIERDRLSELPDEILVHILSFLPTIDAVRTVLLRRFGTLWTLVPSLWFDDAAWETNSERFSRFSLFIYNVLIFHKSPTIETFRLQMWEEENWEVADDAAAKTAVQVWVRFALSRKAKTLILDSDRHGPSPMPASIFMSQSLVRLELDQCDIQLPSQAHMVSLRTLALRWVSVVDDNLNEFLSGCHSLQELVLTEFDQTLILSSPSIEKLVISEENPIPPWKINCPNLKILDLFVHLDAMEAINFPCLRELTIGYSYQQCAVQFRRFLEGLQNVEVLTLVEDVVLQFTNCLDMNVGFPRNRWKCVVLKAPIQDTNIAGICGLVRNSPCLEELIIHHVDLREVCSVEAYQQDSRLVSWEAPSPCVASNLKLVSIHGYGKHYGVQLQLVEFLLKSAVNLDKLVIFSNPRSQLTSTVEQEFVKQLSSISSASRILIV